MKRHAESHLDHDLTTEQVAYLFERFADRAAFFIETLELPPELGTVPCFLYGPTMGDEPIQDVVGSFTQVHYETRHPRTWTTRTIHRDARPTRTVTVIAGPHEEKCDWCDGRGECQSLEIPGPGGPSFYTCRKCTGAGKLQHPCILYTAFGGPLAPQEPGDIRLQMEKLHIERAERDRTVGDPANGCMDEDERARLDPSVYGKIVSLRKKREESDAFWSIHALGYSPMKKLG